jgi:hypothetical protein
MKASRKLSRRSFAASVMGGMLIGGSATALLAGRARAQMPYSGVTDSDTGGNADRPGYGTGQHSVHTDSDTGPNADAQFHGRGTNSGATGTRYNPNSTPATGCSDQDRGQYGDPGGHGRTCRGWEPDDRATTPSRCTDSDANPGDPGGDGVHCTPR